jgi:FixJ family two-component response regulator
MGEVISKVYLVDDEPLVLKALTRLLKINGYEPQPFLTARAFLNAYDPRDSACLILDLNLPDMNGLELQRHLFEIGSRHPIIFLSGHADVPRSVEAMKSGAVDFLTKPVHPPILISTIHEAIARSRVRQKDSELREDVVRRCSRLSLRERQVVDGMASGLLNKQIAATLGIVEKTVKVHRARAIAKLDCRSSFELLNLIRSAPDILPLAKKP